ncbi:hypothetical protein ACFOKI_00005, partial [Sphingomonas qilianensis]
TLSCIFPTLFPKIPEFRGFWGGRDPLTIARSNGTIRRIAESTAEIVGESGAHCRVMAPSPPDRRETGQGDTLLSDPPTRTAGSPPTREVCARYRVRLMLLRAA